MMSVPAINSVLPASGSQPSKISSSPTANPSVSPLGLPVPPKLSVIPPPQIPTSPSKPPIGVNHSSVPLSLVYENKVNSSQAQSSITKSPSDKPKDLSPAKPTSNGVEESTIKAPPPSQQTQSTVSPSSKPEDTPVQPVSTNHSEERIPPTTSESTSMGSEGPTQNLSSQPQYATTDKIEQILNQNISKEDEEKAESRVNIETPANKEEVKMSEKSEKCEKSDKTDKSEKTEKPEKSDKTEKSEAKSEKSDSKTSPVSQPAKRKREQKMQEKKEDGPDSEKKPRRIRSQVLPYQSPLPEITTFINKSLKERDASQKNNEERLIVFYRNEFLAVRNAEGGFYLCQTLQNVYRSSHRIRIRWLSQVKEASGDDGDIYTPDFYDLTDFECILTTVALNKLEKNKYKLPKVELDRIANILKRALDVEKGVTEKPSITEEHPDGIDLSLYKDESQLQKPKRAGKRKAGSPSKESSKQAKKEESGEIETKAKSAKKVKGKSRIRTSNKVTKITTDKRKSKKRPNKSTSSKSRKAMDQLKNSPPNEKARVVAKILRKISSVKAVSTIKQAKTKTAKRASEVSKTQKKKPQKTGKKGSPKETGKEEPAQSHHDRRHGKNKYSNNKNKKN